MPNKVYRALETRITFEPSGGDVTFTLTSLGADDGQISNRLDRGSGSIAGWYAGVLRCQFATAPVAGDVVRIYLVESWEFRDGGTPDVTPGGDLPETDSAITDQNRFVRGGIAVGNLIVPPSPAADTEYVSKPFHFFTAARYIQFGVWNDVPDAFTATAGEHELAIWPVPPEIQT